jgi:hypothetical protein
MHLDLQSCFEITTAHPETQTIPQLATVQQILEQYLDLSAPPSRHLIRVFAQAADPAGSQKLSDMLAIANEANLAAYSETHSIGDFVTEYAVCGFPEFGLFVSSCPHIVPRLYSIVSQPSSAKRRVELIVSHVTFGPDNQRKGLCTSYIRTTQDAIAVRIERASFRYPRNKAAGFVAIGIGNGIPMIVSLLEYRANLQGAIGPMVLILEGTTPSEMAGVDARIRPFLARKLVNTIIWAYADQPGAKFRGYADAIRGSQSAVWDLWMDSETYLFATGCKTPDLDTIRDLLCRVTVEEAGLRDEEAMAVSNQHEFHFELNGTRHSEGQED